MSVSELITNVQEVAREQCTCNLSRDELNNEAVQMGTSTEQ